MPIFGPMNAEHERLQVPEWKRWGPYVTNRQWATVREDYSEDSNTWNFTSYKGALHRTYRWGEDGIAGISDDEQLLCFSLAFWNTRDPFIKERLFGLTNGQGNHGEDVKELYYYLDNTPTHSYMKMLYKYPQEAFPYQQLIDANAIRNRFETEFEITDTGIFDDNNYFDIEIEYAKNTPDDILIKISVHNRGTQPAALHVIPMCWFRNTWAWGDDPYKPRMTAPLRGPIQIQHRSLKDMALYVDRPSFPLFCDNETNPTLLSQQKRKGFYKDGINDFIVNADTKAINRKRTGTRAAYDLIVIADPGIPSVIRLRLAPDDLIAPFESFDHLLHQRKMEADVFYEKVQEGIDDPDERNIQRQAFAGMLWNKQFYFYDVDRWIEGDPVSKAPDKRKHGRNSRWMHLHNADIISMPDKWEYPWYAAWDLAFHCIPLSLLDLRFAKEQLLLLTRERYMHPNGQLPAYEWDFSDVNPPVHAWAAWKVYKIEKKKKGKGEIPFLESIFHKLLMNFTWWVNRKDTAGNNIFQGGFLGLDNIGVFDRNSKLPHGGYIEQADGTSWMAMFALNMMRIALELARNNPVYQDMATKFFEHFLYIAGAMAHMGEGKKGLWDPEDGFFYDQVRFTEKDTIRLKVRSMVGLIPLFAVEVLDEELVNAQPEFKARMKWFLDNRPDLAGLISRWEEKNENEKHLLSLLRAEEIKQILQRMLDETEFLSDYGIRSLSKYHQEHPFHVQLDGNTFSIAYTPGESTNDMFGGNSNWRGPIWMPLNYLIIESLRKYHFYFGNSLKVECPTGSGILMNLEEVAHEIAERLTRLFRLNDRNERVAFGDDETLQQNEFFRDNLMFYEYFHGDTGKGLGATQQTGWTGLISDLLRRLALYRQQQEVVQ